MKKFILAAVSVLAVAVAMASPASATCFFKCGPAPSGSGSSYFNGQVGSQNLAGGAGGITKAMTSNWKTENGGSGVEAASGQPTTAYGFAHVATGGSGMASTLALGFGGPVTAESGVTGMMSGNTDAGFQTGH